jgi:hypothetical protein
MVAYMHSEEQKKKNSMKLPVWLPCPALVVVGSE